MSERIPLYLLQSTTAQPNHIQIRWSEMQQSQAERDGQRNRERRQQKADSNRRCRERNRIREQEVKDTFEDNERRLTAITATVDKITKIVTAAPGTNTGSAGSSASHENRHRNSGGATKEPCSNQEK